MSHRRLGFVRSVGLLVLTSISPCFAQAPAPVSPAATSVAPLAPAAAPAPVAAPTPQPVTADAGATPSAAPVAPAAAPEPAPNLASASAAAEPPEPDSLSLYKPLPGEAFVMPVKPPPPEPPPPPEMKGELVAYSQVHALYGGMVANGSIGEVGIRYGAEVSQVIVGYIPANQLAVFGVSLSNLLGWKVAEFGKSAALSILAPGVDLKVATDFEDVYFAPAVSALGLAYVRCSGFPLSLKVRGPVLGVWLPFVSAGQEFPDTVPMLSVGASLELGVVFF